MIEKDSDVVENLLKALFSSTPQARKIVFEGSLVGDNKPIDTSAALLTIQSWKLFH